MSEQIIDGCENYTFAFLDGGEQNLTLEWKVCVENTPLWGILLEAGMFKHLKS